MNLKICVTIFLLLPVQIYAQLFTSHMIDLRSNIGSKENHIWHFHPGDSPLIKQTETDSSAPYFLWSDNNYKLDDSWISPFPIQLTFTRYKTRQGQQPFSDFDQFQKKYQGYAWYRTEFTISESDFKNIFKSRNLVLRLGKIGQADAVYLNGVFIGGTGLDENTPANQILNDELLFYDKIRVYKIPGELLKTRQSNVLAIRVFAKYNITPGLAHDKFYIVSDKKMERSQFWDDFKKISVILISLFLGLFYLFWQYIFRENDKATIYFSLASFSMAFYLLTQSQVAYVIIENALWLKKIEYASAVASVHLILKFVAQFTQLKTRLLARLQSMWDILGVIIIVVILFLPDMQFLRRFMFGYALVPAIMALDVLFLLFKAKTIPSINAVRIGFIGMLILLLNDFLVGMQFRWVVWEVNLADYAMAFFSLSVAASIVINMIKNREIMEKQEKQKENLSRFFSPQVMEGIMEGELTLGGSEKPIATIFADIVGFTSYSEKNPPAKVVEKLNLVFEALSEVIFEHGATLDKYIGDCIMAFWGAPKSQGNDAFRAISCALKMQKRLREIKEKEGDESIPFQLRIGVNYGPSIVGNIGSKRRMDYTVIGDAVNTAARIESNGEPGRVAVSDAVFIAAGGTGAFVIENSKEVIMKGKSTPILIHFVRENT